MMVFPVDLYLTWLDAKNRRRLVGVLAKKFKDGVDVPAEDARRLGRASGLPVKGVGKAVRQLMLRDLEQETYEKARKLASELDKVEPLEQLPDELKPSLMRLTHLAEQSREKSDLLLLAPIQHALADLADLADLVDLVDLKAEVAKTRRYTGIVNILGVVGLFVGLIGLYLTPTGPSVADIQNAVREVSGVVQPAPNR